MNIENLIKKASKNSKNFDFSDLCKICNHYFGAPRQKATSHRTYKTPWPGNPRVNIQKGKGGKAKDYQVKQVLQAIEKLKIMR